MTADESDRARQLAEHHHEIAKRSLSAELAWLAGHEPLLELRVMHLADGITGIGAQRGAAS